MSCPRFVEDADLGVEWESVAWALSDWPGVEKSQPYPAAPTPLLPYHAQMLVDLGFRYHPELAVLRKVPGEGGRAVFIGVGDEPPVVESAGVVPDDVMSMLMRVDPDMADRIACMSPGERAAEAEAKKAEFEAAVAMLSKLSDS